MSQSTALLRVLRKGPLLSGPIRASMRHVPTFLGRMAMERWMLLSRAVPGHLRQLAEMRAASLVECAWCMDVSTAIGREMGFSDELIEAVGDWQASPILTDDQRLVIEYADRLSRTPVVVPADVTGRLAERFSRRQIVDLTNTITWENARARFNQALGLDPEGYSAETQARGRPLG